LIRSTCGVRNVKFKHGKPPHCPQGTGWGIGFFFELIESGFLPWAFFLAFWMIFSEGGGKRSVEWIDQWG
jgi:hypothetical protein